MRMAIIGDIFSRFCFSFFFCAAGAFVVDVLLESLFRNEKDPSH